MEYKVDKVFKWLMVDRDKCVYVDFLVYSLYVPSAMLVILRKSFPVRKAARASLCSTAFPGFIPSWHGLGSQKV